jgi:hypothetical protein
MLQQIGDLKSKINESQGFAVESQKIIYSGGFLQVEMVGLGTDVDEEVLDLSCFATFLVGIPCSFGSHHDRQDSPRCHHGRTAQYQGEGLFGGDGDKGQSLHIVGWAESLGKRGEGGLSGWNEQLLR